MFGRNRSKKKKNSNFQSNYELIVFSIFVKKPSFRYPTLEKKRRTEKFVVSNDELTFIEETPIWWVAMESIIYIFTL
jgi:hypothetical protein